MTKTKKTKTDILYCSICQKPIQPKGTWIYINHAYPVNNSICCDICNSTIVIPARIELMARQKTEAIIKDKFKQP